MSPLNRAVVALGTVTIISYGALYYAFAVLAADIARDLGQSVSTIYACLSAGLFIGALCGRWLGSIIDRLGARRVMAVGSVLSGLALALMSRATTLPTFAAALILVEIVSFTVFYSASMTALTQIAGASARRSITHLTLIGGFASSLAWPATQWMSGFLDWRGIYLVYAGLLIGVCAPLLWLTLAQALPVAPASRSETLAAGEVADAMPYLSGPARMRALILLSVAFSSVGMVYAAMNVLMIGAFEALGLSGAVAVGIAALMGPAQVLARIGEMASGDRAHPMTTALVSAGAMALGAIGLAVLAVSSPAAPAGWGAMLGLGLVTFYVLMHGVSQGLSSIVQGAAPLALFGPLGFGRLVGTLGMVRIGATSVAPLLAALSFEKWGHGATFSMFAGLAAVSMIACALTPRPASESAGVSRET